MVVDPGVPTEIAGMFRVNSMLLTRIRAGWRPEPPVRPARQTGHGTLFLTLGGPVLGAFAVVLFAIRAWPAAILIIAGMLFLGVSRLAARAVEDEYRTPEGEVYEHARWYDGRYLLPIDFDYAAQILLARTQRAIGVVLHSHVNAEGLLDNIRNGVMLPAQEWEIARLLAKLSALRAEHHELAAGGLAPEVAAVIEPLERALSSSEAAVVARIEALERYAGHVGEAERAYHARGQIEELRSRLPRYEELLAESGADGFAVPELSRLADDADQLEQVLSRSVRSAHEAFRYLDGNE